MQDRSLLQCSKSIRDESDSGGCNGANPNARETNPRPNYRITLMEQHHAPRQILLSIVTVVSLWSTLSSPAGAQATANPPPKTIPAYAAGMARPDKIYLHDYNAYHLQDRVFYLWLGDTPKAYLFKVPADFLSSDDDFYYFRDSRPEFGNEWAFVRKPENDFLKKRSIWRRKAGDQDWEEETSNATLASPR